MIPNCDSCGQPMRLSATGHGFGYKGRFRIRRFHCDLCDISFTIYASGERDIVNEPREAIDEVQQMYKDWSLDNDFHQI